MKILYLENDEEIVSLISKDCEKTHHELFLLNESQNILSFLNGMNNIDLIIIDLNLLENDNLNFLKEIRQKNPNLIIVVISENDMQLTFQEYEFLKIRKFIQKPFELKTLKNLIFEIELEQNNLEENSVLKKQNIIFQNTNNEINLFLSSFKELAFYSETDLKGVIIEISDSFCNLIGYNKSEIIGKKHSILSHPLEDKQKYKELWESISKGENWIGELRCKDKLGNDIWYKTIIFPRKNNNGNIISYVATRQDISDKKNVELLSITNELTGLYNRRFFNRTFLSEKKRAKRTSVTLVFLMIDIDYFKNYNDTYGHLSGDEVLKAVAEILKLNSRRTNDFAFRLGGEEFAIITSDLDEKESYDYAENIRISVEDLKIKNENTQYKYLTVSIGVFVSKIDEDYDIDQIYDFADKALYKAKSLGRNKTILYK